MVIMDILMAMRIENLSSSMERLTTGWGTVSGAMDPACHNNVCLLKMISLSYKDLSKAVLRRPLTYNSAVLQQLKFFKRLLPIRENQAFKMER